MVDDPIRPTEFREMVIQMPVVRRQMEVADVTWSFDAAGWIYLKVNGDAAIGLRPDRARALAEAILARAADSPSPDPIPQV